MLQELNPPPLEEHWKQQWLIPLYKLLRTTSQPCLWRTFWCQQTETAQESTQPPSKIAIKWPGQHHGQTRNFCNVPVFKIPNSKPEQYKSAFSVRTAVTSIPLPPPPLLPVPNKPYGFCGHLAPCLLELPPTGTIRKTMQSLHTLVTASSSAVDRVLQLGAASHTQAAWPRCFSRLLDVVCRTILFTDLSF